MKRNQGKHIAKGLSRKDLVGPLRTSLPHAEPQKIHSEATWREVQDWGASGFGKLPGHVEPGAAGVH